MLLKSIRVVKEKEITQRPPRAQRGGGTEPRRGQGAAQRTLRNAEGGEDGAEGVDAEKRGRGIVVGCGVGYGP